MFAAVALVTTTPFASTTVLERGPDERVPVQHERTRIVPRAVADERWPDFDSTLTGNARTTATKRLSASGPTYTCADGHFTVRKKSKTHTDHAWHATTCAVILGAGASDFGVEIGKTISNNQMHLVECFTAKS